MLAQDAVTGQLYEVPDAQLYETEYGEYPDTMREQPMMYDGLGNPVGLPFLAPILGAALPAVASALAPTVGRLVPQIAQAAGGLIPGVTQAAGGLIPQVAQAAGGLLPQIGRIFGGFPGPGAAAPLPAAAPVTVAQPMPRPWLGPGGPLPRPRPFCRAPAPVGWVTPALPFTGMHPRRLYLRCSVWPGPKGLVPEIATQPMAPVAAPGMAPVYVRRRRRRGRR